MSKRLGKGVLFGLITIFILMVICSVIFSMLLQFTSMTEDNSTIILTIAGGISLFFGSIFAGLKSKAKGWLVGLLTSGVFTAIIYLVQFLGYNTNFSTSQTIQHAVYLLVSIFGGIFGVNLSGGKVEE